MFSSFTATTIYNTRVWVSYIVISSVLATNTIKIVRFEENSLLEKHIRNENLISVINCSLVICGVTCTTQRTCASFSYTKVTTTCRTHSKIFSNLAGAIPSEGTKYYTQQISWPAGTYALPKPVGGCPISGQWTEGWRYQDTDNENNNNQWSISHSLAGSFSTSGIKLKYCVKTNTFLTEQTLWSAGQYCILKKNACPQGFQSESIYWDDENQSNANTKGGTLPDGIYNQDTKIYYCCRNDAVDALLVLPTESPFYLMSLITASRTPCPNVLGMTVERHFIDFDNEVGRQKVEFCYYKK